MVRARQTDGPATQTDGPKKPEQRWFSTDRELKALKPAPAGKRYITWDKTKPHLGVRVTATGRRSFVVVRRLPGDLYPTMHVLGSYPAFTLKKAREDAPGILGAIVDGKRPRDIETEKRRAEAKKRRDTLAAAVGTTRIEGVVSFLEDEQTKELRTSRETETILRREFLGQTWQHKIEEKTRKRVIEWHDGREPIWRDRPVLEITRRDVIERLDAIKQRGGKHAARHALGAIRKFFNWCAEGERFGIETSPCANISDKTIGFIKGKGLKRNRVLTDDELRDVWHAAAGSGSANTATPAGYPFGPLVRLLALTGQRLNDIASAQWSEIDLDGAKLTVPAERYKTDAAHEVPLSPLAVKILRELPRFERSYVFTTTAGARPISGFTKMKGRLDAAIAKRRKDRRADSMKAWILHDLRRTVRTRLVGDLNVEAYIAERVIGHALSGLDQVYDQGTHRPQKRDALERWAVALTAIVEPTPAPDSDVVSAEEVERRRRKKSR